MSREAASGSHGESLTAMQISLTEMLLWIAALATLFATLRFTTTGLWLIPPVLCTVAGWKVWPDWLGIGVGLSWGIALGVLAMTVIYAYVMFTW